MRRITRPAETREECLRRATDYEWLAREAPAKAGADHAWHMSRLWRGLALAAAPEGESDGLSTT